MFLGWKKIQFKLKSNHFKNFILKNKYVNVNKTLKISFTLLK